MTIIVGRECNLGTWKPG